MTSWRTHSHRIIFITSCFVLLQVVSLGIFLFRRNHSNNNDTTSQQQYHTSLSKSSTTPSFLLPVYYTYAGLNNGLASLHFISHAAKEVNRVLLMDPVIHNYHARTYSLSHCGFWFWKSLCYPTSSSSSSSPVRFNDLFQFDDSDTIQVIYDRISGDKLRQLPYCAQPVSSDERKSSVAMSLFKQCEQAHHQEQYLAVDDHMYASGDLRANSDPLFNIHPTIFKIVQDAFNRAGISLNNSIVVHKRMGDFKGHCKNKASCNYPLKQLATLLREKQLETRVDHVIFITNEAKAFEPYVKEYNWVLAAQVFQNDQNIPALYRSDHNACAIMEMATGISSKYFIGNPFSTYSEFIGIWRRKSKLSKETTLAEASLFGDQPSGHGSYLYHYHRI